MDEDMVPRGAYRIRRRGVLLAVLVALALPPTPVAAQCVCTKIAPTEAELAAEAIILPLIIRLRITFVDALAGAMGSIQATINNETQLQHEAIKAYTKSDTFLRYHRVVNKTAAEYAPHTDDWSCHLSTLRDFRSTTDGYAFEAKRALDQVLPKVGTSQEFSPTRMAAAWLYKLCKSGQLRRGTAAANYTDSDFGQRWFDDNQCVSDPVREHAFLRPSTILDHPVLVPPSKEEQETLDNPATYDPADGGAPIVGTPAAVWARLKDKQKLYVSARLFCENLTMGRLVPAGLTRDQMLMPGNQAAMFANLSDVGILARAKAVCDAELARRTAYDYDNPDNWGFLNGAQDGEHFVSGRNIGHWLQAQRIGRSREEYFWFDTHPVTGLNIPGTSNNRLGFEKLFVSPYMKERHAADYCSDLKTASDTKFRNGSAAQVAAGQLECLKIQQAWELREVETLVNFTQIAQKISEVNFNALKIEAAPAKARFDGGGHHRDRNLRQASFDPDRKVAGTSGGEVAP